MHARRSLVALCALALVAVPAQGQIDNPNESTPTSLYFHVFDTFNKFVVNTQPMDSAEFRVGGANFPTLVGTPVNDAYGAQFDFNTVYGYSTAGPVEYGFIENGKPRMHPERGIAQDVVIDTSVQPVVYLYGTLRDLIGEQELPNAMVDYTLRVQMREGDDPGRNADYDSGALIMSGEETFHVVRGEPFNQLVGQEDPNGVPVVGPDANGVIEFAIPLTIDQDRITKASAYNIRLDWYQLASTPVVADDQFSEGYMRLHADPDHLPRLEMNVMNPVYISFVHPQVAAGTLLIHTGMNSPWGTYDIDPSNITISVTGPSTPINLDQVIAQNQHVHGLHDQDAEVTYLWKFRDEGAANGDYTITIEVPNSVGNAVATATAGFTIEGKKAFGVSDDGQIVEPSGDEDSKGSPSIGFLGALGLLGAALLARRRA